MGWVRGEGRGEGGLLEGLYVSWIGGGYVKRVFCYLVVLGRDTVESRDSVKSSSWEVLGRSCVQGVDLLISWAW